MEEKLIPTILDLDINNRRGRFFDARIVVTTYSRSLDGEIYLSAECVTVTEVENELKLLERDIKAIREKLKEFIK